MPNYDKGYFEFFERNPGAERRDYEHQDGVTSVVAISFFNGEVDEAFLGVYENNGKLRSEQYLPHDHLEKLVGDTSVGSVEVLSRLTELATEKAGTVVVRN
jgi:hypothetical protein